MWTLSNSNTRQVMPKIHTSVLTMRTIAFLESLFAPTHDIGTLTSLASHGSLNDWFSIQTTTPGFRSTGSFGAGNWLCVQINLRACIPDEKNRRNKHFKNSWGISPQRVGLPLNRQMARIPDLSRENDIAAVEYLLSVAMVLRKRTANPGSAMKYDIITWLDYTNFGKPIDRGNIFPVLSHSIDVDLGFEDCGAGGEPVVQFLMVLAKSIDHWKHCWDKMIDKIDDIISVQLQDTLDKKRWNSLMFDDSLQLSEQYFTILQLLRIWQNWIGETEQSIENLDRELYQQCESWRVWQWQRWPLDMEKLRHNIKCLQKFFRTRSVPLRERMKMKKDEVTSLQDALLSSSSLRETLKTLWTIPFLQSDSDVPTPKGFAESFIAVPVLTYILSGFIILYFWATSSRHPGTIHLSSIVNTKTILNAVLQWAIEQVRRVVEAVQVKLTHRLARHKQNDPLRV
ncbi:hypothetical protein GGR55DRAFT_101564 [Xylaria sp. FL0064]|nr:hypothetical protein GGR55DRAFT_101564 [Xylaria sp. FL0064]